ncbi:MAG: hypothetical protein ACTSO7_06670 [Candidatus Heimdallarchaeota archaeon]
MTDKTKGIPETFTAGTVDKLTYALMKFGDQQIHCMFEFNGHFNDKAIKRAVRLMLDAEPVLGSKFIVNPKKPYWQRRNDLDELEYCTIVKTTNFDKDLFDFVITPCDPVKDLPVQARIFRNDTTDLFCLKTNHAVMDGGAIVEYMIKLGGYYQELLKNPDFTVEPNIAGDRDLKQVLKRFNIFQKLIIFFRNMSSKPNWAFPWSGTEETKPTYLLKRFPPERFRKIKAYSKKYHATINDITLTAFYRAIFEILQPKPNVPLVTVLTVNLRMYLPDFKAETLCNLTASAYPELTYIPDEKFEDTLIRMSKHMKKVKKVAPGIGPGWFIYRVFKLPFQKVVKNIQNRFDKDIKRKATHPVFTNVGLLKSDYFDYGHLKVIDIYLQTPITFAPGFIIGLLTFEENMTFSVGFCEGSYEKEKVQLLLDLIDKNLQFD